MRKRFTLLLSAVFIGLLFVATSATGVLAGGQCADTPSQAASLWGGDMSDWQAHSGSNKTGWDFNSADGDELVRAPFVGSLIFDKKNGKYIYLWSDSSHTRRIWINHGTVWCRDNRNHPLSKVIRTPQQAANKYRAGNMDNWNRIPGAQSEGWHVHFTVRTKIYVFRGHADTEFGRVYAGNWTKPVFDATGWFFNT